MNNCIERKTLFSKTSAHEFEAIYDIAKSEEWPNGLRTNNLFSSDLAALKTKTSSSAYVKSVCKYCGAVINRDNSQQK